VILGVPSETIPTERRVALTPAVAAELIEVGHEVRIATGAGESATWDDAYEAVGCDICGI